LCFYILYRQSTNPEKTGTKRREVHQKETVSNHTHTSSSTTSGQQSEISRTTPGTTLLLDYTSVIASKADGQSDWSKFYISQEVMSHSNEIIGNWTPISEETANTGIVPVDSSDVLFVSSSVYECEAGKSVDKTIHSESINLEKCDTGSQVTEGTEKWNITYNPTLITIEKPVLHKQQEVRMTMCEHCGKVLRAKYISDHMRIHFKRYQCDICKRQLSTASSLRTHRLRHTGEKCYVCELCGRAFIQKTALQDHRANRHRDTLDIDAEKPSFGCRVCGAKFFSPREVYKHRREEHLLQKSTCRRIYNCDTCGDTFQTISRLKAHAASVHGDNKLFSCNMCGKRFSKMQALQSHLMTHTDARPFKCKHCGRSYTSPSPL